MLSKEIISINDFITSNLENEILNIFIENIYKLKIEDQFFLSIT